MSLSKIIKSRVSNTNFNEKQVDSNLLIDLLDVAVYAPNHKMREPWRFIILQNEGKKKLISKYLEVLNDEQKEIFEPAVLKVFKAPVVVAFIMPTNLDLHDELEDMEAVATVIQNFMLLATEAGLATAWKTPKYIETEKFKEILGLSIKEIVIGLVMVGYSDLARDPKPRKAAKDLTTIYK
ncbi:MAG: nitroreductase [Acholeplasmataceae bacterium]|nr:nitroreductase [Acholeplasmataceae bacterium]